MKIKKILQMQDTCDPMEQCHYYEDQLAEIKKAVLEAVKDEECQRSLTPLIQSEENLRIKERNIVRKQIRENLEKLFTTEVER